MRILELGDVAATGNVVRRDAAKAVVERDGRFLLLRTPATGDLKLPGGGVDRGETHQQALARELLEETGRRLAWLGPAILRVIERRPDAHDAEGVFEMTSTYYRVEVTDVVAATALDDYENDLGLTPVWVTPIEALHDLDRLLASGGAAPWTAREAVVLRLLVEGAL